MINTIKKSLLVAALLPAMAMAQDNETLASWTFESGYAVEGTTYTPQGDYAEIGATWFNQVIPIIRPDACAGNVADYAMTALSNGRYWQMCSGYQNHVFRIENVEKNAISDYTDASKHNVYYEVQFPTTGYKNIAIDYACAYGANAEATLEAVVSTDGGNTWFDAGAATTASTWWTYNPAHVALSANNKESVIVRLIAGNDFASNWNLDYLTVTGEKQESAQPIHAEGATLTWPFDQGPQNSTSATASAPDAVSATSFTIGSALAIESVALSQTKLQPAEQISKPNDDNAVTFSISPKKGVTFRPTHLSFKTTRYGTNGGLVDVHAVCGDQDVTLATGIVPARNNDITDVDLDITGFGQLDSRFDIVLYLYSLGNTKQVGFGNIVLTGDFDGTPVAVPVYTMSVKCATEGAGSVSCNPAGAEFDEGTPLKVTATENFGYHFAAWVNETGDVVSTDNPYTFEITENTSLLATYTQKNVYALNLKINGGANDYLVSYSPLGNVVNGVHYYEEGTDVKLTTANNRILTFTNWEDNTTEPIRDIKMNGEVSVEATYACEDFIVGWDLYRDQPGSERAADYADESENSGLLSLHNADGQTTSWLTCGMNKGGQNGKYGARIWKMLAEKYFFEVSFSTLGYSNLKLHAALGDDYNAYSIMTLEYSLDGQSYTRVDGATWNLPNRGWDEQEYQMPAALDNQAKVYLRFMPDYTSPMSGVASDYDGTTITNVFVLADKDSRSDDVAPVLVNSIPANGATGASATGSIVLTFDEKILANGTATLDGEQLTANVAGKTVTYRYSGLKYATNYTFTLPAGAITDRNGNAFAGCQISFTTMERRQPEARLFDAIVAQDGSGDYTSIQAAVDAAPAGRAKPWLIFIKEGKYEERVVVPASKPFLSFIGQGKDKVCISYGRLSGGDNAYSVADGATVVFNSNDIYCEGISFENSWGVEMNAGPQALAMNTQGDRIAFSRVAMRSYQDTWITTSQSNNRAFCKNSVIEGAVDFIYNNGNLYCLDDTLNIVRKSGGYIVAPRHSVDTQWGYVFMNNVITAPGVPSETDVWLGRPWHDFPKTVYINTKAEVTIPAKGWYNTMGGLPVLWADYNTVDGNGNPVDLSNREDTYYVTNADGTKTYQKAKNYLTAEEAAQYTVRNVMSGQDNWDPEMICEPCDAPRPARLEQGVISWEAVPYAICYVISCDGAVVDFTTDTQYPAEPGRTYAVQAVSETGALSPAATAQDVPSSITTLAAETVVPAAAFDLMGRRVKAGTHGFVISQGRKLIR